MKRISYVLVLSLLIGGTALAQSTTNQGTNAASGTQSTTTGQVALDQSNGGKKGKNPLADLDLKQQINQKLSTLPALRFVTVDVNEGKVTLTGTVPTKADRKKAQEMAKSVAGVRKVKDKITIDANATSSDENEPTSAGAGTKPAESGNEGASTSATKPEAQAPASPPAAGAATSTGGIAGVATGAAAGKAGATQNQGDAGTGSIGAQARSVGTNTGQPSGAASETPSTVPGMRPQADSATIQGHIEKALRDDPALQGSNVNVRVADDAIELSGNVPTAKEKTTAWRIASSYAFNRRVKDRIVVTGRGTARPASPTQDPNSTPAGQATPPSTIPKDGSLPSATVPPNTYIPKGPTGSTDVPAIPR
jgi:osmotically-inducible protein OsmY